MLKEFLEENEIFLKEMCVVFLSQDGILLFIIQRNVKIGIVIGKYIINLILAKLDWC